MSTARRFGFIRGDRRSEAMMPAFQPYAGDYSLCGQVVRWRCYATARLHGLRRRTDAPLPQPPQGKKWLLPTASRNAAEVALLVDQEVSGVSQILLQIEAPRSGEGPH